MTLFKSIANAMELSIRGLAYPQQESARGGTSYDRCFRGDPLLINREVREARE